MYTAQALPIDRQRVELEVSLPGEGRERTFRVAIKVNTQDFLSIFLKSMKELAGLKIKIKVKGDLGHDAESTKLKLQKESFYFRLTCSWKEQLKRSLS